MAWFWQKKKEESDLKVAQTKSAEAKSNLLSRVAKPSGKNAKSAQKGTAKKAAKKSSGKAAPTKMKGDASIAHRILVGPIVTEKAALLAESGTYVFAVTPHANKIEIARAIAGVYNVTPRKVTVVNEKGKSKVFAQKMGRRSGQRKAYVTLTAGESIELFEKAAK
jgi:large subunit ribosomal protein L23